MDLPENQELLQHFRELGALRKSQEPLRLGSIQFSRAGNGRIGFTRQLENRRLNIYVNQNDAPWEISAEKTLMGRNLLTSAVGKICIGPMGFCITEE